jgi:O-antigen/teichoic acid export membrane protein
MTNSSSTPSSSGPPELGEEAPSLPRVGSAEISLGGAAVLGVLTSGTSIVAGVVRSKATATILGAAGVGKSALILQFFQLAAVPLATITGAALVVALAKARAAEDVSRTQRVYDASWTLLLVASVVTSFGGAVACLVGVPQGLRRELLPLMPYAALASVTQAASVMIQRVLVAFGALRANAWVTLVGIVTLSLGVVVGTYGFGLTGQLAALALCPIVGVLVGGVFVARTSVLGRSLPRPVFDGPQLQAVVHFGASSLVTGLAAQAALTAVRLTLERHGGPAENGQFQSAWAVTSIYFGSVMTSIGTYVFPRFAAAKDAEELGVQVDEAFRFVVRVGPPVILAALAVRRPLMHLLYSGEFDVGADIVGFFMAADLLKAASWVQAGPLLYRRRLGAFVFTEVSGGALLALCSVALVPRLGPLGCGIAYAIAYALYFPLTAFVLRRSFGVVAARTSIATVVGFSVVTMALMVASRTIASISWVFGVAAVAWAIHSKLAADLVAKVRSRLGSLGVLG